MGAIQKVTDALPRVAFLGFMLYMVIESMITDPKGAIFSLLLTAIAFAILGAGVLAVNWFDGKYNEQLAALAAKQQENTTTE